MTHTSTEQPEALRLAECLDYPLHVTMRQFEDAAAELRRLYARVQELEASQAQRVPLNAFQRRAIFDDLYPHGATSQMWQTFSTIVTAVERFGITHEKQQ